jgi:hypothetical protein
LAMALDGMMAMALALVITMVIVAEVMDGNPKSFYA